MNTEFVEWLMAELDARGMSQTELSRQARLSSGSLSNIVNGDRRPGARVCVSIARALNLPPEEVMRYAGLLPEAPPRTERIARFIEQFARLRLEYQKKRTGRGQKKAEESDAPETARR